MTRDIQDIYDSAILEKETLNSLSDLQPNIDSSQTLLSDLNSSSKVARWRLMIWVMSFMIWLHEQLFDTHKEEIESRASELITGTKLWYRDQALKWQYGDSLVWNGKRYEYAAINTSTQIIKRAAVIEVGGQVRIKVAKLDGTGLPVPLTTTEKDSFVAFMQKIKFAGTNILIISRTADLLKLSITVHYDPLILSATGELLSSPGTRPVDDAITSYIQSLPFNGILDLSALIDVIQTAQGVLSPFINSADAKYGTLPYQSFTDFYQSEAGHLTIDPAFPLTSTITYVQNV